MKYICRHINQAISIDGNLDKPQWAKAEKVQLSDVVTGETPNQATTAMLLWDDQFLYAAFDCEDNEIHAQLTGYNDLLYDEDVVELFMGDSDAYMEFEINPLNAVLHYYVRNNGGQTTTYARTQQVVRSAVQRTAGKTYYECAIPLEELGGIPKPGTVWQGNLYRIDRGAVDEYTALSPTGIVNYHVPQKFASFVFEKC